LYRFENKNVVYLESAFSKVYAIAICNHYVSNRHLLTW